LVVRADHELEYEIRIATDEPTGKVERELAKLLPEHTNSLSRQQKKDFG